ncbi:MAG TPA: hypothetical protein ENK57_00655, partial [Polyangiaceae bacterium]|nr:hypothetical protein [Polyangiaceae bacterium]
MAPKFNPAEFVDVFNHEARMLVGPRCDFHPDRPKPERGVHVWPGLALLPGHNVVALDPEWSTMADHTTIRRWLELGMIEERMPDI